MLSCTSSSRDAAPSDACQILPELLSLPSTLSPSPTLWILLTALLCALAVPCRAVTRADRYRWKNNLLIKLFTLQTESKPPHGRTPQNVTSLICATSRVPLQSSVRHLLQTLLVQSTELRAFLRTESRSSRSYLNLQLLPQSLRMLHNQDPCPSLAQIHLQIQSRRKKEPPLLKMPKIRSLELVLA